MRPVIPADLRPGYALLSALTTMAWLFAILGFAHRHLTRRPVFLAEATEDVYPFYLRHLTVIAVYWFLTMGVPPVAAAVRYERRGPPGGSGTGLNGAVRRESLPRPPTGL